VVRAHWPLGRAGEWKYLCDDCRDTGWEYRRCKPYARCQPKHDDWDSEREHDYVVRCHCPKGHIPTPIGGDDELVKVGRTKRRPTTSWSRPGR
jgi:hypothetical protein